MQKSVFFLVFITFLLLSNNCYSQQNILVDSTSYDRIVGMERNEAYEKLGVTYSGGAVIGWVHPSPKPIMTHAFGYATFDGKNIFMLEKITGDKSKKIENQTHIVDQMVISSNSSDYHISYMGCTQNGERFYPEGKLIAVFEYTGQEYATNISKAWKADFNKNKFFEITADNIKCELEPTYFTRLDNTNRE